MTIQAKVDDLLRWHVYIMSDTGRKITWARTADEAREKVERNGHTVTSVKPAPSAMLDRPSR